MKKLLIAAITSLSMAVAPVYADPGRGGPGRGNFERGNYERHNDRGALWAGVAAIGAIAGLAILAENSRPAYAAPAPVYVERSYEPVYQAPVAYAPPQPPANVNYYCQSSAMYYPYTKACPEGWQMVQANSY